jgi:two-component system sensor histidine kinase PhcS
MVEITATSMETRLDLRKAFRAYESVIAIDNARRAAALAATFMMVGSILDWVVYPDFGWSFLLIRAVSAILLAGIFVYLGKTRSQKVSKGVTQGIALLPMIAICGMIAITEGGNSVYYAGISLVLVGLSLLLRWSFINSLFMIGMALACYALSVAISPVHVEFRMLFNNCYFIFTLSKIVFDTFFDKPSVQVIKINFYL